MLVILCERIVLLKCNAIYIYIDHLQQEDYRPTETETLVRP